MYINHETCLPVQALGFIWKSPEPLRYSARKFPLSFLPAVRNLSVIFFSTPSRPWTIEIKKRKKNEEEGITQGHGNLGAIGRKNERGRTGKKVEKEIEERRG